MTEEDLKQEQYAFWEQEQKVEEARKQGYCFYCDEELKKCTGYKCWLR